MSGSPAVDRAAESLAAIKKLVTDLVTALRDAEDRANAADLRANRWAEEVQRADTRAHAAEARADAEARRADIAETALSIVERTPNAFELTARAVKAELALRAEAALADRLANEGHFPDWGHGIVSAYDAWEAARGGAAGPGEPAA